MVWTKVDFEREVRRQLVEIASIRKRLPPASELLPRINLLEASHRSILRKLRRFRAEPAAPARRTVRTRQPKRAPELRSLSRDGRHRPGARATCPSCGQSLSMSLVPPVDVIYHNDAWYHRRCASRTGLN
jgi:hypothetical protein